MTKNFHFLEDIPISLLPKRIHSVMEVSGGLNNKNILVNNSILIKKYLSHNEHIDPVFLRYKREKEAIFSLKNTLCSPTLLNSYEDSDKYYITREWIPGYSFDQIDFSKFIC